MCPGGLCVSATMELARQSRHTILFALHVLANFALDLRPLPSCLACMYLLPRDARAPRTTPGPSRINSGRARYTQPRHCYSLLDSSAPCAASPSFISSHFLSPDLRIPVSTLEISRVRICVYTSDKASPIKSVNVTDDIRLCACVCVSKFHYFKSLEKIGRHGAIMARFSSLYIRAATRSIFKNSQVRGFPDANSCARGKFIGNFSCRALLLIKFCAYPSRNITVSFFEESQI